MIPFLKCTFLTLKHLVDLTHEKRQLRTKCRQGWGREGTTAIFNSGGNSSIISYNALQSHFQLLQEFPTWRYLKAWLDRQPTYEEHRKGLQSKLKQNDTETNFDFPQVHPNPQHCSVVASSLATLQQTFPRQSSGKNLGNTHSGAGTGGPRF